MTVGMAASSGSGSCERRLCSDGRRVLDGCELPVRDAAAVREATRQVVGRRCAGERAEVAVEVRLVVVAAVLRDLRETRAVVALQARQSMLEAEHPGEGLGGHAEVLAKLEREVARAAADLGRERAYRRASVGRAQPAPGPHEARRRAARLVEAPREDAIEQVEARVPGGQFVKPLG